MNAEDSLLNSIAAELVIDSIVVDDKKINFVVAGHGPDLLLLHGANIGWGQWYKNIAVFSKKFRVYAIDLPGSVGSSPVNYSDFDLNRDLLEIVEKFILEKKLKKPVIVGHSIGAWIAASIAVRGKIDLKSLVLAHPIGFSKKTPIKQIPLSIKFIAKFISKFLFKPTKINLEKFIRSEIKQKKSIDPIFVDYYFESVNKNELSHPFLFISSLMKPFRLNKQLNLVDDLQKIKKPTLILFGKDDKLVKPRYNYSNASKIPNSKIKVFDSVGHVSPIEAAEEFNRIVLNFAMQS